MRAEYPSDINREQFARIQPMLEGARKKTKPRKIDLYDVFCAILYILRTGCQWRSLPSDFPKWGTVYSYYQIWAEDKGQGSLLEYALKNQVCKIRERSKRKCYTTFLILDSQSVKNTDTAQEKGYDAGKKVSGIKRHLAVDTLGLPHAIAITRANVGDREGGLLAPARCADNLDTVQAVLCDGGYTGEKFAAGVHEILHDGVTVQIAKRNELHTFEVLPKRWIVERSFAWLEKNRRLWKNCERLLNTSLQFVLLAFIALILKRF